MLAALLLAKVQAWARAYNPAGWAEVDKVKGVASMNSKGVVIAYSA